MTEKIIWTADLLREFRKISRRHGIEIAGVIVTHGERFGCAWGDSMGRGRQDEFFRQLAAQQPVREILRALLARFSRREKK